MSVKGVARVGRRTKELVRRMKPREIAVIAHPDLDPVAAASLAALPVAAVINTCRSVTGRYPNRGPELLVKQGIPVLDCPDPALLERLRDGDVIELVDDEVVCGNEVVAAGALVTAESLTQTVTVSGRRLGPLMERFVLNTVDHVVKERNLFLGDIALPPLTTDFRRRHALVVARGAGYREDLRAVRSYLNDARPVVVAVDGAADALLAEGIRPQVILGDMDSVSDRALTCGAELVVHAYADGRAPGLGRVRRLGLEPAVFAVPGTSEDAALLLAHEAGADLVVAVGTHSNPIDFLEKGRSGMASTFLVRLRVGPNLVDARGLSRLCRAGRLPAGYLVAVVLAGLVPALVVVALSPSARSAIHVMGSHLRSILGF